MDSLLTGTGWLVMLSWLLVVAGGVLVMVWAIGRLGRREESGEDAAAVASLQRRYARGEIVREEYQRGRAELLRSRSDPPPARLAGSTASGPHHLEVWAAGLSLAAGLIHLVAAPEHLREWWGYGYFFLAAAIGQVLYAQLLFRGDRRGPAFYAAGLLGTLGIIALYAITRTMGIPLFGPAAGEVEPIGALDLPSKLVELALVVVLAILLQRSRSARVRASEAQSTPSGPSDERRVDRDQRSYRLSRRALLIGLAGGAVGLLGFLAIAERWLPRRSPARAAEPGEGLLAASPRARAANGTMEIQLTAEEVAWELAPGKRIKALSYNGQVPGPELRVREGERLRVVFTNRLSVPTTIHWHGVDVPNPMDGVPDLTQPAVQPGDTFVYEFDARPAGTRWYHTHFASTQQLDRGLYAPLIIEPAEPEPNPPDREYILVLSAWVTGQGSPLPPSDGMMGWMMGGMMGPRSSDPGYDTLAVNGKAFPATQPLLVREGDRVRLRLINASGARTHLIFLEGHRLRVTHTDGNPLQQPVTVDAVPIAPAERYDVEFTADRPGVWSLHDLLPGQTEAGLRVQVVYDGHEGQTEAPLRRDAAGLALWSYAAGRGADTLPVPAGSTRDYRLTLSGGMMGSDVWTINGRAYPDTDPLPVRRGDRVRLRLFNMSMESHPMHLHGHSFRLNAIGVRRLAAPLVKDVVDVQPMEAAELEFVADNPGNWLFHCHKPMHMEGGMVALVRYESG